MQRNTYSADNPLWTLPTSLQVESKPDLSLIDENEAISVSEPGSKQSFGSNGILPNLGNIY